MRMVFVNAMYGCFVVTVHWKAATTSIYSIEDVSDCGESISWESHVDANQWPW